MLFRSVSQSRFILSKLGYPVSQSRYILGAYSSKADAEYAGEVEKSWRGYSYEPNIVEMVVDSHMSEVKVLNHTVQRGWSDKE